jgi:hypothetical protein
VKADERSLRCGDRIPLSVYAPVSPDHHPERDPAQPDRRVTRKKAPGQKGRLFTQAGVPATVKGATGIKIAIRLSIHTSRAGGWAWNFKSPNAQ